ncbi:MAG: heavy-metal-associated domain-containing protein [Bacteroidota bacterium]
MKNSIILLMIFVASFMQAQKKENKISEIKFSVKGNCDACKKRIENAADIKGVKFAEWSPDSQQISVKFRNDKVSEKEIKEAILKSGHDVEKDKAPDEIYSKLPACCKFRDTKCTEK